MNIKKLLLLLTALLTLMSMNAQQISEQEALAKAQQFFGQANKTNVSRSRAPRKVTEMALASNRSEFYVFNDEANGGYVIISGDERMPDVLAYSYDGLFDADNIPCNMKSWMEGYAEQVKYLRAHPDAKVIRRAVTERENISPLLTCKFNQGSKYGSDYYNIKCPKVEDKYCYTGCVATAMAQIMYYFQWPKQTTGVIPGYVTNTNGIDMPAIPITTIDWDNMLSEYNSHGNYTQKQKDAIATLMLLCGSSVQMDYALEGSGATLTAAAYAFRYYWGYDDLLINVRRNDYDTEEWEQLMYDELNDGRPIMYDGFRDLDDDVTGHAFVLDGYEDGYFHVNWGWGGKYDYVQMTEIEGWREYTSNQTAIIGIQPIFPDSPRRYAVFDNNKMTLYYDNNKTDRSGTILPHIENWSNYTEKITECVIDPSFADIKQRDLSRFFCEWKNLTSIQGIENLNTSMATDMSDMFWGCSSLTNLDVSNFKTDKVTGMDGMFSGCSSLTSLDVSGFKTDNVTNMSWMFAGCNSLRSLDVSGFKTDNVTSMGCMFSGCSGLMNLDVSGFKTDNVTSMWGMFARCSGLTSLDLSGFNTDNVTDMGSMFDRCSGLTSLDLSGFNTANVVDMHYMFDGCSSLTSLDVSGFNTEKVKNMGYLFRECNSLTSLDLSNFNTDNVTDMSNMFAECYGLTSLDISGFNTENVTDMSNMFAECSSLTSLDVSGFKTGKVTNMSWLFAGCSSLTSLDVSGFNTENATSMERMFVACNNLTSLDVSGFKTHNVTDMKFMFSSCESLTSLDVSGFNTDKVTDMSWMFNNCSCLTSLDVSHFKTDNVTSMERMFTYCSGLTNLDVSGFMTGSVTNMKYMFARCSGLTSLDVSGFKTGNVTNMLGMFIGCKGLTNLDVSGFKTEKVTNMNSFFDSCSNLTSLDVSGFKTHNVTDMQYMFSGCSSLTSLDVSGFKTGNVTNMKCFFEDCFNLSSLDVSGFNTSNVTDMSLMFDGCSNLTCLDLSSFKTDKVTNMRHMFYYCNQLSTIYVSEGWDMSNVENAGDMFIGCSDILGGMGTTYDSYHLDGEYARVDGGPDNPGYFTYKEIPDAIGTITSNLQVARIYDLQGKRRDNVCKGLNIVVMSDGTVKKVMIK